MTSWEDPQFKNKYTKYKLKVKLWESDFMENNGRKPKKDDIKAADSTIREAYKMYWKLKTRVLEETLTGVSFAEDADENIFLNDSSFDTTIQSDTVSLSETISASNEHVESTSVNKVLTQLNPVEPETSSSLQNSLLPADNVNVRGVFGEHLNIKNNVKGDKEKTMSKSKSFQLSQNKFQTSKLPKRNPRKSAPFSKIQNKSKENLSEAADCSEVNVSDSKNTSDVLEPMNASEIFDSQLFKGLKIINSEKKISSQSLNTTQQLMEKPVLICNRKLNEGWLSRCIEDVPEINILQPERLSNHSDSGIDIIESRYSSNDSLIIKSTVQNKILSDEEDYVCNSDSEEERKRKRRKNFNKIVNEDLNPAKKFCPGNLNNLNDDSTEKNVEVTSQKSSNLISNTVTLNNSDCNRSYTSDLKSSSQIEVFKDLNPRKNKFFKSKSLNVHLEYSQNKNESLDNEENKKLPSKKQSSKVQTCKKQKIQRSLRSKHKKEESFEDVTVEDDSKIEVQPSYSIESLEVVPRLPLKTKTSGNLVSDFSQILEFSKHDADNISSKKMNDSKDDSTLNLSSKNLNQNYVRINLKKKVFVRGKKTFNYAKYKKNQWKQRKKELASSEGSLEIADTLEKNGMKCFKCGENGHFSRQCQNSKEDNLLSLEIASEVSDFPTLEEAEQMAKLNRPFNLSQNIQPRCVIASSDNEEEQEDYDLDGYDFSDWNNEPQLSNSGHQIPETLIEKLLPPVMKEVQPVYELESDGSIKDTPLEVLKVLLEFGHKSFRPGQEEAIMRILSGKSTLVTLATGSGKSLCYQLPAYMYAKKSKCITLVVSPLVSLMDDQVSGIPDFLSAACFHTNQSTKVREKTIEKLKNGKLSILLVSPEAIVAGEKSNGFGGIFRDLPPVAFACIDEAHCISQWSHNFRPSYLMVSRVLRDKLGVKRILALTATASHSAVVSMVNLLHITDGLSGVISEKPLPSNLNLSVSRDESRDDALVRLLRSEHFTDLDSIIVYCTRREECVRIAGLLRVTLQDLDKVQSIKKNKVSEIAEAYHAGLSAHKRKQVQTAFMKSEVKIVVATVAFGMGINKPDIRSVIHYNMPASFESYVQEIGRAGRDGLPAYCHLFLSPKENSDEYELRRHINSNGIDRHTIRRLLQKIFIPCCCASLAKFSNSRCPGHEVAFGIDETVNALDISEETIATLLCYLELHPKNFIKVLSNAYTVAKIHSYAGSNAIKLAAQKSPPLAMAIASALKKSEYHESNSTIEFPVIDVAAAIGWDSGLVKSQLKNLEWTSVNNKPKRSALTIKYETLGFRVKAPGDLSNEELDEALESLYQRSKSQEILCFKQLKAISMATRESSFSTVKEYLKLNEDANEKSEVLKNKIRCYFEMENPLTHIELSSADTKLENEAQVVSDIRSLIGSYKDNNFTGRSVARIFHGIQSPNYPAVIWSKCRFWRSHLSDDFGAICQLATKEILKFK